MGISDWSSDVCSSDLFGTANLRMIHRDGGVIFDEPSLCCLAGLRDQPRFVASGAPVFAMTDRTPAGMRVRRPLRSGVLQDIGAATPLLRFAASQVIKRRPFQSAERSVGNALVSTCRSGGSPEH